MLGVARQDSSCSTHGYSHADYDVSSSDHYVPGPSDRVSEGSHNKRSDVVRDVSAPTQKRKKVKPSDWEQTEAAEGGPVDPELIPSYGGHCRSRYMALTGWELTDSQAGPLASGSSLTHLRSCIFEHANAALLSAFVERWQPDTNSFHMPWSEMTITLHDVELILGVPAYAWIYLYFPLFAPPFRHSPEGCKPYMQMFPQVCYKSELKLMDICLRLDLMTADEVRWMPYQT
ncbi:hypothetical protein M9H77_06168 [Catharanthus roseus]|uniref:Uncharacterized protein n=1 Tax=Catharanthus roseus TaxID=4058 RepID=A0ACC0BRD4_CATRO|nr:hypothetical protein M9H77_06168 [Catharanthus roseus]